MIKGQKSQRQQKQKPKTRVNSKKDSEGVHTRKSSKSKMDDENSTQDEDNSPQYQHKQKQKQDSSSEKTVRHPRLKSKLEEKEKFRNTVQNHYNLRNREQSQNEDNHEKRQTRSKNSNQKHQQQQTKPKSKSQSKKRERPSSSKEKKGDKQQKNVHANLNQSKLTKEEIKILNHGNPSSFGQQVRNKVEQHENKTGKKLGAKEKKEMEDDFRLQLQKEFVKNYKYVKDRIEKEETKLDYESQHLYKKMSQIEKILWDIKATKRRAVLEADKKCRFSFLRNDTNFSLSRANYWKNYDQLAKGCQVYKTPQGREFHNWLCFQCFYVYQQTEDTIQALLFRFAECLAKLVLYNIKYAGSKNKKGSGKKQIFRNEVIKEICSFLV